MCLTSHLQLRPYRDRYTSKKTHPVDWSSLGSILQPPGFKEVWFIHYTMTAPSSSSNSSSSSSSSSRSSSSSSRRRSRTSSCSRSRSSSSKSSSSSSVPCCTSQVQVFLKCLWYFCCSPLTINCV